MEEQTNYTELLEQEYGQDEGARQLIQLARQDGQADEEIYHFLESFY